MTQVAFDITGAAGFIVLGFIVKLHRDSYGFACAFLTAGFVALALRLAGR